jgi:hypothetical protein
MAINCFPFQISGMAKSRADVQRAYRERKKKELGQDYFDKEKKRVKEYYIPTKELSRKDRDARNLMKNEGMRRSRDKKKKEKGESLVVVLSLYFLKEGFVFVRDFLSHLIISVFVVSVLL